MTRIEKLKETVTKLMRIVTRTEKEMVAKPPTKLKQTREPHPFRAPKGTAVSQTVNKEAGRGRQEGEHEGGRTGKTWEGRSV